jgi:hypothetical protein
MDASFNTQDLRAAARDYKRDADSKKWEHGVTWGPGQDAAHPRPAKSQLAAMRTRRPEKQWQMNQVKVARRRELANAKAEATDSSADEEVEPSAAPEPDAEVTYSFDAKKGPSHGSQILGHALAEAVERYEHKETEKLVKDEYLVLDSDGEPVAGKGKKAKEAALIDVDDDSEYEIL